ncbi:hypothetical protein ACHAQJ_004088 [Trichoderma viride]
MRTSTFIAVAFAALAQAQTRADIPSCALPCLDQSVTANTKCSTTDYVCICKDFSAVQAAATSCVISKCGADVAINKVLPATQALCSANAAGGSGSSAAASSSAAATSAAQETTSAAGTTAAQTSAAVTSAAVSSAPSSVASSAPVSSAPSTVTVGTASTTIVTTTPVGSGVVPPTGNRTTTGPTSAPTGAASALLPGLAMLALGVLAL